MHMKNIKSWALGALVLCSAFFGGCGNNRQENLKECEQYVYMDSLSNAHVCGFVSDADGNALANVMVTSGEDTIFSSEEGVFSFERCRTVNGRCVVKFENSEYFSVIRTAEIVDGGARVDAVMMPQDTKEGVTEVARFLNSQGATIKVGKMEISIPANSLVYENDGSAFDGSVLASVYYLDPNSEDFAKEMPGGDMSGVTNDGKNVILLSYGMVELPNGKMKSREGTVVDADDLVADMISTAREMGKELGRLDGLTEEECENTYRILALGALKYFILKVDPRKNMTFNPKESIDFNGNTGPFIQYAYARIQSVLRKAAEAGEKVAAKANNSTLADKEIQILRQVEQFPAVVKEAGEVYSPALVANFAYDLAKEYNQYYHDFSILKEENAEVRANRILLSSVVAKVLKNAMWILGIEMPQRM